MKKFKRISNSYYLFDNSIIDGIREKSMFKLSRNDENTFCILNTLCNYL